MQQKMALLKTSDDLESRILNTLHESGMHELQRVSVEIEYDRVILQGEVRTYYAKQMAQVLVGKVDGAPAIQNDINVTSARGLTAAR